MSKEALLKEIYQIPHWRQKIELEPGVFTPGSSVFPELWDMMHMPNDLKGKSFLDVGANDGLFSFLAEKKGANRVVAVDIYDSQTNSSSMTEGWSSKCIESVKAYTNSNVEIQAKSIYDLEFDSEKFDVVFCSNVVIWLDDIYKAHRILAEKTKEVLFIREDILLGDGPPQLRYSKLHAKHNDKGHFIGNKAYYRKTFEDFGFKEIEFYDLREDLIWNQLVTENPTFIIPAHVPIFSFYEGDELITAGLSESKSTRKSAEVGSRTYFRGIGWVNTNQLIAKQEPVSSALRLEIKHRLRRFFSRNEEANYIIIAKR